MRIKHNISALNSRRHLMQNTRAQARNLERLSSGLRINRGADGPAQLIISERLRTQQVSLKQAIDNNEAGVTMLQTAEAALDEGGRLLARVVGPHVHALHTSLQAAHRGVPCLRLVVQLQGTRSAAKGGIALGGRAQSRARR